MAHTLLSMVARASVQADTFPLTRGGELRLSRHTRTHAYGQRNRMSPCYVGDGGYKPLSLCPPPDSGVQPLHIPTGGS